MVLFRAVDTVLIPGFSGSRLFPRTWECPFRLGGTLYCLHGLSAIISFFSLLLHSLLSLHKIPDIEIFQLFRNYKFRFHPYLLHYRHGLVVEIEVYESGNLHLDGLAHLVEQFRSFKIGEHFSCPVFFLIGRLLLAGYADRITYFVKAES